MVSASSAPIVAAVDLPFTVENPHGLSPFLLIGDHAGRAIPADLGDLGVPESQMERHIAWDIGVAGLGGALAKRLDAAFIRQHFSRLVVDCNRDPSHEGSVVTQSDGCVVPANIGISDADRAARVETIFTPYHAAIAATLDARAAAGRPTVFIALHSFTPTMDGFDRPWRFGVLHDDASPFSAAVLAILRAEFGDALVGDNEPYALAPDGGDFTVPHHALGRGLDYLELEVRQDLIATLADQAAMAEILAPLLEAALTRL